MKHTSVMGQHLLADLYNCQNIKCPAFLEKTLSKAAIKAGATILKSASYDFGAELGATVFMLLSESHISIHTWPEKNCAALDIYMCGSSSPDIAMQLIRDDLRPGHVVLHAMPRGVHYS